MILRKSTILYKRDPYFFNNKKSYLRVQQHTFVGGQALCRVDLTEIENKEKNYLRAQQHTFVHGLVPCGSHRTCEKKKKTTCERSSTFVGGQALCRVNLTEHVPRHEKNSNCS
jgi:hypothetical protein